ncbi:MAG TPA: NAD-dependent epimerase/dehydratase family protein [Longimicrobium sp.]|nr:NAD-dependent epimerase/dehydratase family protein [Longimicrobium sp.]
MKVLVQGSAGFVASYLIPQLARNEVEHVTCVDPKPPRFGKADWPRQCEFIPVDRLRDVPGEDFGLVISLAGVTDVDYALQRPASAFNGNLGIAIDLAEWLRTTAPTARCIYVSTDEVLGVTETPLTEDAFTKPTQPYAASKAAAEMILHNYRDVYDLDIVTLRSCNLIGGRQRAVKLIPVAVQHLALSLPVPIYGTGLQRREWMSVEDLCSAILLLCDRGAKKGIYHAATGVHLSVVEVVQHVADAVGVPLKMCGVADRLVHDACYAMSSDRLRALGWEPRVDPRDAIAAAAREMYAEAKEGRFRITRI